MKQQILDYIRADPGCTVSGVNGAVRDDKSFCDWIYTRQEIAALVSDGLVEEREYRGIKIFYPKDTP
ncbi:Uncharacterised protein [Neisseria animaloris]|uniref:hypothetical protein n=1 Tax=Neisseria animaloris TaxID=326522 RepID=UPI000A194B90|nr:hypothetical protein [Neisseria animaloris]OSI06815.1 hypothetical protein BWD08_10665 [Neisseria animaloris]VEH86551.1 Uncharacterised protein [Neisseria animaloris]